MATYTPNLALWKGVRGDEDWDDALNANANRIDAASPVSVVAFGASTGASAAVNTTAFNDAIATGKPVFVPTGTWNLNALDPITTSLHLYGAGRSTVLVFNTTADAMYIHPSGSLQAETYHIHDLAFDNVTNVPASFIRNQNGLNVRLDHLYFSNCAATYCIDNENGYGLKAHDCVFSDITGSGLRLQDNGPGVGTKYSYSARVDACDFTRISGDGITVEGSETCWIGGGTVIESCAGKGIRVGVAGGTVPAWNIILDGVYFEANTGDDLYFLSDQNHIGSATLIGCSFVGTPTIALGTDAEVTIIGCFEGGGSVCTISGSTRSQVTLINSVNFTQNGTFNWVEIGGINSTNNTTTPTAFTPAWSSSGTQPAIGNGTLTGVYTKLGRRVDARIALTFGNTTTPGTGNWYFSLPFAAAYTGDIGLVGMDDVGSAPWTGVARTTATSASVYLTTTSGDVLAAAVGAAAPFGWGDTDVLVINISYWV